MFIYNNIEFTISNMDTEYSQFRELKFLEILRKYVNSAKSAIDVGCNVGNHTIYFSKIIGCKFIYCFEPIPFLYAKMLSNFKNNGVMNIKPYNLAISSKNSVLKCISKLPNNGGSYWLWYDDGTAKHPYERGYAAHKGCDGSEYEKAIKSVPLDSIIPEHEDIGLIKIDVEGMELEVIKGGMNTITKNLPVLQIEVAVDNNKKIHDILTPLGYRRIETSIFTGENQLWAVK